MSGFLLQDSEREEPPVSEVRLSLLSARSSCLLSAVFCAERCPEASRDYFLSWMGLQDRERYDILRRFADPCLGEIFELLLYRETPEAPTDVLNFYRVYVSSRFFDLPRKAR